MANQINKPVHQAFSDYDLLEVSVLQNQHKISLSSPVLWRLNLCAASKEIPCTFFIAMNYKVKVYRLDTINSCFKDAIKTLASPNALRTGGGPHDSPYIINAIKVDKLLNEEVLVSVAENGEICIWRTEHLDEPPMIFNNNGVSTWGIALHSEQGLLAVSANNFKITVYNMLELTKEKPVFGAASIAVKYWLKDTDKIEFEGHNHNIPNIDFNATGRYIASASIDSTCKVWDLYRRQLVSSTKVHGSVERGLRDDRVWCWATKFIKPGNFKYLACNDKELTAKYMERYHQGRSTSLSSLDLCHSANIPAFPMSVSLIFDLDDDDVDFEIYEGEGDEELEAGDDAWDDMELQHDEQQESFARQMETRQEDNVDQVDQFQDEEEDRRRFTDVGEETVSMVQAEERGWGDSFQNDEATAAVRDNVNNEAQTNVAIPVEQALQVARQDMSSNNLSNIDIDQLRNFLLRRINLQQNDARQSNNNDAGSPGWLSDSAQSSTTITSCRSEDVEMLTQSAEEEENDTEDAAASNDHIIPKIVRSVSRDSSLTQASNSAADRSDRKNKQQQKLNRLQEFLIHTTKNDVFLHDVRIPNMKKIRAEHDIISRVDIRTEELLSLLDRISMVEWLPELELMVVASQKGTVALMRVLQVEFENGLQGCFFNNEYYLPHQVLQTSPLYGITVRKVESERFAPTAYEVFLFYHNGNVLGYTISCKEPYFHL